MTLQQLAPSPPRTSRYLTRLALIAMLAASVSACISPADDVNGFLIELFGFIILCWVAAFVFARLIMRRVLGQFGGIGAAPRGGLPGSAVIEGIADTGFTISSPGVGPNAPRYDLSLRVTGPDGIPYEAQARVVVPRIYAPMIVPGAQVGVFIDPSDRTKVSLDFSAIGTATVGAGMSGGMSGAAGIGGASLQFDAGGRPSETDLAALTGAVSSGAMPTQSDSAARLLATGTHGTAVVTTCQPLGKTVRQINPAAPPSQLDDPVWLFTLQVSIAGENPFPAVFGHRVPMAKAGTLGPGVKLAVAVDMTNRNQDVAIDWDRSPIAG